VTIAGDFRKAEKARASADSLVLDGMDSAAWNAVIRAQITRRHSARGPLFFELRCGTGWGKGSEQRLDAFAMEEWPSKGLLRYAYEVKVSRADFLREMKDPTKRRQALYYSNEFAFVTPPGIVKPEEVPLDCGLVEVHGDGLTDWKVKVPAPRRDGFAPSWLFFAAVARHLGRLPTLTPGA
jgi:hypothetical protein